MTERGLDRARLARGPVDPAVLGRIAAETQPGIAQLLIGARPGATEEAFERELMLARKAAERATAAAGIDDFFVVSCSGRTIIYKGFCLPDDLAAFYLDLQRSALHQRDRPLPPALQHQHAPDLGDGPAVPLPRPQRRDQHRSRATGSGWRRATPSLEFPTASRPPTSWSRVVSLTGSDSLSLDDVVELLYHGGRSLPHALMMLVPEPWEQLPEMDPARRAFYDFHAGLVEQWDGPAALAFRDGVLAGATLDRNGLRPLRYAITADGLLIAGPRPGTVAVDQATVIEKGRLGPGQMIVVDTRRGIVLRNDEIKARSPAGSPTPTGSPRQRINDRPRRARRRAVDAGREPDRGPARLRLHG